MLPEVHLGGGWWWLYFFFIFESSFLWGSGGKQPVSPELLLKFPMKIKDVLNAGKAFYLYHHLVHYKQKMMVGIFWVVFFPLFSPGHFFSFFFSILE